MNTRFYLIVALIFILTVAVVVVIASRGPHVDSSNPPGLAVCTVNDAVGISQVTITNQNTGKSIIKTSADLPYSFNFTRGDSIRINVTVLNDYRWNAWEINQSPWFAQDNPMIIKADNDVVLTPKLLVKSDLP